MLPEELPQIKMMFFVKANSVVVEKSAPEDGSVE